MSAGAPPADVEVAVSAGPLLRLLDRRRRVRPADLLYRLYVAALVCVPSAYVAAHAEGLPLDAPEVVALRGALLAWGPVVLAGAILAVARFAAWAGLVVPETGEVAWVLSAPIRRSALLRPRLTRSVATTALAAALLAYPPTWFVLTATDASVAATLFGGLLGGATTGVLAAAVSWWVQADERRARAVLRATPFLVPAGLVLGVAALTVPGLGAFLAWSGPWGWAVAPLADAVGADVGPPPGLALALATATALVAAARTLWRADAVPLSEFARRAAPFSGVRSALFIADTRFAAVVRRQAVRQLLGIPRRRLPRPSSPWLVVPWIDALGLLRSPRWLWTGAMTGLTVALVARAEVVTTPPGLVPLTTAVVGGLLVGSQSVDGLRAEHGSLVGSRYVPWPPDRLVLRHLAAPVVAVAIAAVAAGLVALVVGAAPATAGLAVAGAVLAAPALVGLAALGATAPDLDASLLLGGGESGANLALSRLMIGPLVGLVVVWLPAVVVLLATDLGAGLAAVLPVAIGWLAVGTAGIGSWLRRRVRRTV